MTELPVSRTGSSTSTSLRTAVTPTDRARQHHGGQQRNRRRPTARRDRRHRAHARGALFHVDAAQGAGKVPIDVEAMRIDLLSLTGHKMYGPKGCGALFVRKRTALTPLIIGGGQERGLRSGTLNVPGIVGLGAPARSANAEMARTNRRRWRACAIACSTDSGRRLPGSSSMDRSMHRLPNNLHVSVRRSGRRVAAHRHRRHRSVVWIGVQFGLGARRPTCCAPSWARRSLRRRFASASADSRPKPRSTTPSRNSRRWSDTYGHGAGVAISRAGPVRKKEARS